MIMLGIDAHKRSHTVVAVDDLGRRLGGKTTTATTTAEHLGLIRWADQFGPDRAWAVEDCRHLSRRLERDMLAAGERLVRVPPKLMAHARDAGRSYGKSDPIDALAVPRAALREPNLPTAHLDAASRELRLLVDHREDLIAERTRHINRLRWHLHEIDPQWDPHPRCLTRFKHLRAAADRLTGQTHQTSRDSVIGRIAADLVGRIRQLTIDINSLEAELDERTKASAPNLRQIHGVAGVNAAKLIGEVAAVARFRSRHAFALTTAPPPHRCGQATTSDTASAAPATINSMPPSTASP